MKIDKEHTTKIIVVSPVPGRKADTVRTLDSSVSHCEKSHLLYMRKRLDSPLSCVCKWESLFVCLDLAENFSCRCKWDESHHPLFHVYRAVSVAHRSAGILYQINLTLPISDRMLGIMESEGKKGKEGSESARLKRGKIVRTNGCCWVMSVRTLERCLSIFTPAGWGTRTKNMRRLSDGQGFYVCQSTSLEEANM